MWITFLLFYLYQQLYPQLLISLLTTIFFINNLINRLYIYPKNNKKNKFNLIISRFLLVFLQLYANARLISLGCYILASSRFELAFREKSENSFLLYLKNAELPIIAALSVHRIGEGLYNDKLLF